MIILGISAFYHDSAAAIVEDGLIIAAAQEERFTRKKHDPAFPTNAVRYCLEEVGITLSQVDTIVFYDKPLLKFERLLETYYAFAPKGISSFITSIPTWLNEKMFLKRIIKQEFQAIGEFDRSKLKFTEHHLSHAASAFYPSAYESAAILTIDGVGEWATASICHGQGNQIKILKELRFPHSLGLLYSAFTYYLGFRVNSGEYKLMGLAPYGNEGPQTEKFIAQIKKELITIYPDGSIWLNQKYFNYATGLKMTVNSKWKDLFGVAKREPESTLEQVHCDMGLAIQRVTEEVVLKMAEEAKKLTGEQNLCLAGGVALNCVANGKLLNEKIFDNIFIQPAAGDSGGAAGAALAIYHIENNKPRIKSEKMDLMSGSYLGPDVTDKSIANLIKRTNAVAKKYEDFDALCQEVAGAIDNGKVIGWMQGRMEFGPRALGNRSILGDPRSPEMQVKLNLKIKFRESFRPFAPAILDSRVNDYFDIHANSPYMLMVQPVNESVKNPVPANYSELDLTDKLKADRSSLPAITHVDYSARIQTVHKETNPRFHKLIDTFDRLTGCGILINTSFNVRGEPIVCSAEDAYRCFMQTNMDILVIDHYVFIKEEQPESEYELTTLENVKLD
ncbi:MAG: carbamoyltransferase [Cyclobacteriaceae bacterium]